jgi:rod shape-determining protein MreD
MNWMFFAIAAYLALAVDLTVGPSLSLLGVSPSALLIVLGVVALSASRDNALIAALVLGVLADLFNSALPGSVIIGPHAAGFVVGAYAVLQVRNLLFRRSLVTLAVVVLVAGVFGELVRVSVWSLRGVGFLAADPAPGWRPMAELGGGLLMSLLSAVAALVLSPLLLRTQRWWQPGHSLAGNR